VETTKLENTLPGGAAAHSGHYSFRVIARNVGVVRELGSWFKRERLSERNATPGDWQQLFSA
jgi:hypothetical protein